MEKVFSIDVHSNSTGTGTEIRVRKRFINNLLEILPLSLKALLLDVTPDGEDSIFKLACSEEEYYTRLAS